jgi:hypothetical protein
MVEVTERVHSVSKAHAAGCNKLLLLLCVQVVLAAANFERRMGNAASASALFEEQLQREREKSSSSNAGFVSLLYANFLRQVRLR